MAENNRPHFIVPKKKIIKQSITSTGRTILFKREDYRAHGHKLITEVKRSRAEISKTLDSELTDTLFIEISTPPKMPIKNEKKRFKDIGIDLVSYSDRADNIGIAKISSTKFIELEERLERYSSSFDNIGKTNLSIIENISTITVEDKISEEILRGEEEK